MDSALSTVYVEDIEVEDTVVDGDDDADWEDMDLLDELGDELSDISWDDDGSDSDDDDASPAAAAAAAADADADADAMAGLEHTSPLHDLESGFDVVSGT